VPRFLVWALAALVLSACAHRAAPPVQGDSDFLTGQQLVRTRAASVYEAVLRLRPTFFRPRGPTSLLVSGPAGPALWVDQSHVGDIGELRDMPTRDVVSVRYLPAWQAATQYGSRFSNGVLVVTTRP
jgi:hypothetical protein